MARQRSQARLVQIHSEDTVAPGAQQTFGPDARRAFRPLHPPGTGLHRLWWFAKFIATIPFTSRAGARRLLHDIDDTVPAIWPAEFAGKRALIVGSGPSLDRVDASFFDQFDVLLYVNFALRRATFDRPEYFFTMDLGPTREYLDRLGVDAFRRLGPERCIVAPNYLDLWWQLTPEGRAMFTPLRYDTAGWRFDRLNALPLPVIARYYPRRPDWTTYRLPPLGRTIPVFDPTSALPAVMFAIMCGSRDVGLIGCDFSDGRAAAMGTDQAAPSTGTFIAARAEFEAMQAGMAPQGVQLTNHSWLC